MPGATETTSREHRNSVSCKHGKTMEPRLKAAVPPDLKNRLDGALNLSQFGSFAYKGTRFCLRRVTLFHCLKARGSCASHSTKHC